MQSKIHGKSANWDKQESIHCVKSNIDVETLHFETQSCRYLCAKLFYRRSLLGFQNDLIIFESKIGATLDVDEERALILNAVEAYAFGRDAVSKSVNNEFNFYYYPSIEDSEIEGILTKFSD